MIKMNPFTILFFSTILFLYSIFNLTTNNNNLNQLIKDNKNYLKIANQYRSLHISWANHNNIKKRLHEMLTASNIKNVNIITKSKSLTIKIKNTDITNLDKFMNKILNESIVILNFTLKKNSLSLEVGK
jgi:hypothetical protein